MAGKYSQIYIQCAIGGRLCRTIFSRVVVYFTLCPSAPFMHCCCRCFVVTVFRHSGNKRRSGKLGKLWCFVPTAIKCCESDGETKSDDDKTEKK